ncbi:MAG: hypothetical protein CMJ70_15850 [Planctomycetaceae bacterium]|nr:hypothetical protein [Planctomycetaceae bacterium]
MNYLSSKLSRRHFLDFNLSGLGGAALADLLQTNSVKGETTTRDPRLATPSQAMAPKAKRVIHICLIGGLSHVDSFDYKPALNQLHEKPLPKFVQPDTFFGSAGLLRKHEWTFRQRGQSGLWISDLFPHLATCADDLTIINSMYSDSGNHTPAMFLQNSGFQSNGFPSLGSWLSYGLGNETDDLPTFVVLPDSRSLPNSGAANWSSGFLPARHQGAVFRNGKQPIRNLFANTTISQPAEIDARSLLKRINEKQLTSRNDDILQARIRAYELAARMQTSVPEVVTFAAETRSTIASYGMEDSATADCGRRCLLARRLLERGVRFVQIYSGGAFGGSPRHGWDGHENNYVNHAREAMRIDQPVAALLKDLKQRGLLSDTLILFTSEFGRTPFAHAPRGVMALGRDHNPRGFTSWLAGAGLRTGISYGATDEVGWKSVDKPVSWPDFHATVLQLMGLDHERLTYYHNGIERRLTNVHGSVISELFT